jgi:hypothetical protein
VAVVGPVRRGSAQNATVTLGGLPVALPHAAFLQATVEGEAVWWQRWRVVLVEV